MEDIYESGEMYLETILLLKKSKGAVRSIDIVNDLNYAKSSVSRGINILKSKGVITVAEDGAIEFTETGRERAQEIYERHKILTAFLKKLGVSEKTAKICTAAGANVLVAGSAYFKSPDKAAFVRALKG